MEPVNDAGQLATDLQKPVIPRNVGEFMRKHEAPPVFLPVGSGEGSTTSGWRNPQVSGMAAGSSHSRSRTGRAILKDFDSSKAVRIQLSSSKGFASADIRRRRARPGQPIQFFARDSRNLSAKQRGDQVFCGPLK